MTKRMTDFATVSMTKDEYRQAAHAVTAYLKGQTESLDMFQPHEERHMQDVRFLVMLLKKVLVALWGACLLLCCSYVWREMKAIRITLIAVIGAFALIILYAAIDFDGLFVLFHRVAFTNDLWLLNPETDLMIQLMPIGFFMTYALSIALIWLMLMAILIWLTHFIQRRQGRGLLPKKS